eukprot:PhF_6_TR9234/c1_g4_i2/m.14585
MKYVVFLIAFLVFYNDEVMAVSYVTTESSTYDDICIAFNDAAISEIVLTTSIQFENPCRLQLIDRSDVQLVCKPSNFLHHLICPKRLPCFMMASASSRNTTLSILGCFVLGGGFLSVDDSPINVTIDACTFTTNSTATSSALVHYQNVLPSQPAVRLRISNTVMQNILLNVLASCVRFFVIDDRITTTSQQGVLPEFIMTNVTVFNVTSSVSLFLVGLDLTDSLVPRVVLITFHSVVLKNVSLLAVYATGSLLMMNVTGTLQDMRCVHCLAQSPTPDKPTWSSFLSFKPAVNISVLSMFCEDCKADRGSALFVTAGSNISVLNITVIDGRGGEGLVAIYDKCNVTISNLYAENSDNPIFADMDTLVKIQNLSIQRSRGGVRSYQHSTLEIDFLHVVGSSTSPVFAVYGSGSSHLKRLVLSNTSASQSVIVAENQMLVISSMMVENVTSSMDGGVFAVYDDASLRVDELSVVNSTTLHGSGGVLYCNTRKGCELGGVTRIQGAVSREGYGGILSTGPNCRNASITCKPHSVVEGSSGVWEDVFTLVVANRTSRSLDVR